MALSTATDLTLVPAGNGGGAQRPGIRLPDAAERYAVLDFSAEPMPVISMFPPPPVRPLRDLCLDFRGADLRPKVVAWRELRAIPRRRIEAELVCQITNWSQTVSWDGLALIDVLRAIGLANLADAYYAFHSADGYYFEALSRDQAADPRVILAIGMDGGPLPHRYGGPVRLVVPSLQGYKSVKWLARIEAYQLDPAGIKRLLGQSDEGALSDEWVARGRRRQ